MVVSMLFMADVTPGKVTEHPLVRWAKSLFHKDVSDSDFHERIADRGVSQLFVKRLSHLSGMAKDGVAPESFDLCFGELHQLFTVPLALQAIINGHLPDLKFSLVTCDNDTAGPNDSVEEAGNMAGTVLGRQLLGQKLEPKRLPQDAISQLDRLVIFGRAMLDETKFHAICHSTIPNLLAWGPVCSGRGGTQATPWSRLDQPLHPSHRLKMLTKQHK
jgi:hypothetical protein